MPEDNDKTTENTVPENHNRLLMEWVAPEFIRYPKTKGWYMAAAVAMIALVVYALLTDSATMAIVFLVLGAVYYLTHNAPARSQRIRITELGIAVDGEFYPYNMVNSFWVVYNPPHVRTLNLKISNPMKRVVIQLETQNPVEIRSMLAREIPEVEGQQEPLSDKIVRWLKL